MRINWISLALQKRISENGMHLIVLNNHSIAWKESIMYFLRMEWLIFKKLLRDINLHYNTQKFYRSTDLWPVLIKKKKKKGRKKEP